MKIRANFIHVDSKYLYSILTSKVIIYDKKKPKKINCINIKNPSKIISDFKINSLIICTTKSDVYVFSLDKFELRYIFSLMEETRELFYDDLSHCIYTSILNLNNNQTELIKLDIKNSKKIETIINKQLILRPIQICENKLIVFCKKVGEYYNTNFYINVYDTTNLKLIDCIEKNGKLCGVSPLNSQWNYNEKDGFENIYTNKVILYKSLGLENDFYTVVKEVNNFYFLTNYKNAYILDSNFKIVKSFHEENLENSIRDFSCFNDYFYIVKGSYLIIEKKI